MLLQVLQVSGEMNNKQEPDLSCGLHEALLTELKGIYPKIGLGVDYYVCNNRLQTTYC